MQTHRDRDDSKQGALQFLSTLAINQADSTENNIYNFSMKDVTRIDGFQYMAAAIRNDSSNCVSSSSMLFTPQS